MSKHCWHRNGMAWTCCHCNATIRGKEKDADKHGRFYPDHLRVYTEPDTDGCDPEHPFELELPVLGPPVAVQSRGDPAGELAARQAKARTDVGG